MSYNTSEARVHTSRAGYPGYIPDYIIERDNQVGGLVAQFLEQEFGGSYPDSQLPAAGEVYWVPNDTLMGANIKSLLRINDHHDFYGGYVPFEYMATKGITHPRVEGSHAVPEGWSDALPHTVRDVVLPGYTAFTVDDARKAATLLLSEGAVRGKRTMTGGGEDQIVIYSAADLGTLEKTVRHLDASELSQNGYVLEKNTPCVDRTVSVGHVDIRGNRISYVGAQRFTGGEYAGSDLTIVPGGWTELLQLPLADHLALAVQQAKVYDEATGYIPEALFSRRNYDVLQGNDHNGRTYSGVLESSWRVGSASLAELFALQVFKDEPATHIVTASTYHDRRGHAVTDRGGTVFYDGPDSTGRPIKISAAIHEKI